MSSNSTIHYKLHKQLDESSLSAVATVILSTVDQLLCKYNYLWHKDPFELTVSDNALNGSIRVGDSIEDEWVTLWILIQLSITYDFVIETHDDDGQFILIEAAEQLPSWLTPERAVNRLWVYKGRLHLIGLESHPDTPLSTSTAIQLITNPSTPTLAPLHVENAAFSRTHIYPEALSSHQHTFNAFLPSPLAHLCALTSTHTPHRQLASTLTQMAVEAFCSRDAAGTRAAQRMSRFKPTQAHGSNGSDSLPVSLTLTRTAYAQLQGQPFHPPRVFNSDRWPNSGKERDWRDKGMKLACGFEILYDESKGDVRGAQGTLNTQNSQNSQNPQDTPSPQLTKYLNTLLQIGFFKGEIEGSAAYVERYTQAVHTWHSIRQAGGEYDKRFSFAGEVERLLGESEEDDRGHAHSHTNTNILPEDDDSWLNINADSFDDYLAQRMQGSHAERHHDAHLHSSADTLAHFSDKLHAFVDREGGMDQAKFGEDDLFSDEEGESSGESDSDSQDGNKKKDKDKEADADKATNSIAENTQTKQHRLNTLVPSLNKDEWGASTQKPSQQEKQREEDATVDISPANQTHLLNTLHQYISDPIEQRQVEEDARLRRPHFAPEKYDGWSDEEEEDGGNEEARDAERLKSGVKELGQDEMEDVENLPQVVNLHAEDDIDMQNEQTDFLAFSREALGIDDKMWNKILTERRANGAFVPDDERMEKRNVDDDDDDVEESPSHHPQPPKPQPRMKDVRDQDAPQTHTPTHNAKPNDKLDSFEAVMHAMDTELARAKPKAETSQNTRESGVSEELDEDEQLRAMDHELKSILSRVDPNNETLDDNFDDQDIDDEQLQQGDYSTMRNFLESFKAQSGLSGPVSNLAGSFGERLPRDYE
ncbi:hypothetical protein E3P94_01791 [Wallemia ichthyophaga]|nr:hypothetical protein E3P95_01793 [Wallemia ichthyophaga]TIB01416.1 hypothetical protein E3P94_01791 [Wallemia ichthyophaga]